MEILTQEPLLEKLRMPAVSRLQKVHNTELALKTLAASKAGMPPNMVITARDLVDGHMEKTLALMWHLIFGFQLGQILDEERLSKEIAFLEKSLNFKARINNRGAKDGLHFYHECKRRDLKMHADAEFEDKVFDKNDWANSRKFKLLLQWARLVCCHYGLEVRRMQEFVYILPSFTTFFLG